MKLLFFKKQRLICLRAKSKRLNLFFFMIIIVIFFGLERFADSSKQMIKLEIEFHRERVLFSLLISQTVLACQHDTFELIHEALP